MREAWEHYNVATNGIRLHVVQAGPTNGPLVILLHGFPEFWYGWRKQIGALARAGYRVWVPDQRGYNHSDKPRGIAPYTLDHLAADIVGLINASGREKAAVIGHDWGAAVTWWLAGKYPHRLNRIGILNLPHPSVFFHTLRRNPRQWLKSFYILFFQLPWLPEWTARLGNWWLPSRSLIATSRPGAFSREDLQHYRAAWSQPGAYTSMLNWYRASVRRPSRPPNSVRISIPTLMLWGAQDPFLDRSMAQPSIDLCDNGELVMLEEAAHWLHHEEPRRVNFLLDTFLSRSL